MENRRCLEDSSCTGGDAGRSEISVVDSPLATGVAEGMPSFGGVIGGAGTKTTAGVVLDPVSGTDGSDVDEDAGSSVK